MKMELRSGPCFLDSLMSKTYFGQSWKIDFTKNEKDENGRKLKMTVQARCQREISAY